MRRVSSSACGVIAAGTAASGRWVVTSATRRPPPTSIITTRGVPVCSARYSVWPVKGRRQMSGPMPAGSPEVTAITGGAEPLAIFAAVFDIGAVAHLPDPVLVSLIGLALA
jgi:hypothetical protein